MASVRKREWNHKGETKSAWVVAYTDQGGKRRLKTFDFKKDADRYRTKIETEIERGEHIAASESLTVSQVCELFLKRWEERRRAGDMGEVHFRYVKSLIARDIVAGLGARPMNELTFTEVENWYSELLRRLAPPTARDRLSILKQIESFAIKRDFAKRATVAMVAADAGGAPRTKIRTLKLNEARRLLELVETRQTGSKVRGHLFLKCAVQLAAFCGLRFGEIRGLTVDSIDFEGGVLRIRHSLTSLDEHKGPKTKAGVRDIPLPDRVASSLRLWLDNWYTPNERDLVFRMIDGKIISAANFHRNYWRPLLHRAGLEDTQNRIHFHALRHFSASLMVHLGIPLTDVASVLGHEKFDMTLQVYAHSIAGGNERRDFFDRVTSALASPVLSDESIESEAARQRESVAYLNSKSYERKVAKQELARPAHRSRRSAPERRRPAPDQGLGTVLPSPLCEA